MSHWDEIKVNHKKIIDWKKVYGTVLLNESDITAGPNNCKFILRPVDHSKMKHYLMLTQGSSSSPSFTTTSKLTSTAIDKIFEKNFSFHVKKPTTAKVHFVFKESFTSIDKIFFLGGRLGTRV